MRTIKRMLVHALHRALILIGTGLLITASFIFLYALVRYRSTDPSLFYSDSTLTVSWQQWLLSSCVALMLYCIGMSTWLIPLVLFYAALLVGGLYTLQHEIERMVAWLVLICALSLWGALSTGILWHDYAFFGGLLGSGLRVLFSVFNPLVVRVSLIFVIGISVALITRLAFVKPLVRFLRASIQLVQRYQVVEHVGHVGVVVLRTVGASARWLFALSHRMIQPARISTYDHEDTSIDALVHDAFWHQCRTPLAHEKAPVVEESRVVDTKELTYQLPPINLLSQVSEEKVASLDRDNDHQAHILEEKLAHFGVQGRVTSIKSGPVVTCFSYEPAIDTKLSKITALEQDLALALQALSIRIVAPIPGTNVVGFEVARTDRHIVHFSSVMRASMPASLMHAAPSHEKYTLPLILGTDIVGEPVIVDLISLPHVLLAGSTGSGKSVALHSMLLSLLLHKTPDELKLILIDPKRLELNAYDGIAHLLFPVITDSAQTIQSLNWVLHTMHERYEQMARAGVRSIVQYQAQSAQHAIEMPYIVVVIDELADLMMAAGTKLEILIARIAQMARAAGIHLIVATQRPCVEVVTGLIKVNFVSRIALRVTSAVDSRVILDEDGAQRLVGAGDMLMRGPDSSVLKRIHGAYSTSEEVARVVAHVKAQRLVQYQDFAQAVVGMSAYDESVSDPLYEQVLQFLASVDEVSISLLQRRFRIGFNRSARIIDTLESDGHIMSVDGGKTRKVVRSQ